MNRNSVYTKRYKVGKKTFILIKIRQSAKAKAKRGNALASNQANVTIRRKKKVNM